MPDKVPSEIEPGLSAELTGYWLSDQICLGIVSGFDSERGLGVVETRKGESLPFHCVNIADGSREIALGEKVAFRVTGSKKGSWEAINIAKLGES